VLIAFTMLIAAVAFVVLTRLLWLNVRPVGAKNLAAVAAAILLTSLIALAATGRLHWLAAVAAGMVPFLRRGVGLLRYLPWLQRAFSAYQGTRDQDSRRGPQAAPGSSQDARGASMNAAEAAAVLGLGPHPTRPEIVHAHRRLMQKIHPDRGGTTYLAQQLNEAKRVLLENP
jgi:uncharacterized membrane protein YedE/YeeE